MWRFGGACAACEAVTAEVARPRLSDGLAAEVLFAAGWAVGATSLSGLNLSSALVSGTCADDRRTIRRGRDLTESRKSHPCVRASANALKDHSLRCSRWSFPDPV